MVLQIIKYVKSSYCIEQNNKTNTIRTLYQFKEQLRPDEFDYCT